MNEFELTFLAKYLPKDLKKSSFKEVVDLYIPKSKNHPTIRLRKNGTVLELTKKEPVKTEDSSWQLEQTISLTREEYDVFAKLPGKIVSKIRYKYPYQGRIAEIDVFQDKLKGLVLVDFEFDKKSSMSHFKMPDFCFVDVTSEKFIAGGMLCGKKYSDIAQQLLKFKYQKL